MRAEMISPWSARDWSRVVQPMLLADHPGPAAKHWRADDRRDDPAVCGLEDVGRRRVEAPIEGRGAVHPGQSLLDQSGVGEGDRSAQQSALDLLASPGLAALDQRRHGAKRRQTGRAEIDPRHLERDRLLRRSGEIDGAAHRLADAVETVLVAERSARSKAGHCRQDDVGLGLAQGVEIERQ
jgi:hypothetical protein